MTAIPSEYLPSLHKKLRHTDIFSLESIMDQETMTVTFLARRDIQEGEELTINCKSSTSLLNLKTLMTKSANNTARPQRPGLR